MSPFDSTVTLSLISHTNVGKTTLARTLLRREVGEVLDRPHITDVSEAYPMLTTDEGYILRLWDTPGFGDTARLLKRLKQSRHPVGWLLAQTWDRFADRPLWCSQQAVRNVRDEADIVLYLVNAAEDPVGAGYVDLEMQILGWIGKPVVLLLNQTGPPRGRLLERTEEEKWRTHLRRYVAVRTVLSLDAFARCWIQEGILLETMAQWVPAPKKVAYDRLSWVWREKNLEIFHQSMAVLAEEVVAAARDRELLDKTSWTDRVRSLLLPSEFQSGGGMSKEQGMTRMEERLHQQVASGMDRLIELHGLEGHAAREILQRLKSNYSTSEPMREGLSALLGGMISGTLTGLGADLAAHGLTFGGGAIVGGVLGAAGAGGLAKGYNLVRGEGRPCLRWSPEFLEGLVRSSLLRYLAVAHFGRGRGDYTESEHPAHWQAQVATTIENRRRRLRRLWERARNQGDSGGLTVRVRELLVECARELLEQLYPGVAGLFRNSHQRLKGFTAPNAGNGLASRIA